MSEKKVRDYAEDSSLSSANDSTSDVENFIGTQIGQESDHAIKYRTCSWQKVRNTKYTFKLALTLSLRLQAFYSLSTFVSLSCLSHGT